LRMRSKTPLQALNLLKDAAWMDFSRAMAGRILKEVSGGDDDARLEYAFKLATSRVPTADEREILSNLLEKKRQELREGPNDAEAIVAKSAPAGMANAEFAAWTLVTRTILNLDETITRE